VPLRHQHRKNDRLRARGEGGRQDPNVVVADHNFYSCSSDSQVLIKNMITENNLNRFIVASCTPRTHEALFRGTLQEAA